MGALGRTARRLKAAFAALFLLTFAAALAPQAAVATTLTATAGNGQVTLTWTNVPSGLTNPSWSYRQKKGAAGYGSWQVIPGGISVRTHTVSGLDNGTAYTFQLARHNSGANSNPSNQVTATPTAPASTKTITLSASSTSITEGNTGFTDVTVTATLGEGAPAGFSITVALDIDSGTALPHGTSGCGPPVSPADTDYCFPAAGGATVSIAEDETQGTQTVRILGDTRDEPNETIKLLGYKFGWTSGKLTLTITDDDDPPTALKPPTGLTVVRKHPPKTAGYRGLSLWRAWS